MLLLQRLDVLFGSLRKALFLLDSERSMLASLWRERQALALLRLDPAERSWLYLQNRNRFVLIALVVDRASLIDT